MRESCWELFSTNNSALTFRITPFELGAARMLLFLSQWRGKWTSKETVTAIDYWQLRRSRRLGCDTNTPLWDAAVKIYNCHDSIVPKYHTAATQWTCGWMKWGQWSGAWTQREGQRRKGMKGQWGQSGKISLNGSQSEEMVGRKEEERFCWDEGLVKGWRRIKTLKSYDEKEWGDLPVGAPFFNPFSLIFIALIEDLFLEKNNQVTRWSHQYESNVHISLFYAYI